MRKYLILLLLLTLTASTCDAGITSFKAAFPPTRNRSTPVIGTSTPGFSPSWNNGGAYAGEAEVLLNPLNPAETLMFYSNGNGVNRVVLTKSGSTLNATITNQYVFEPEAGSWDSAFVRKGQIWAEGTTLYMAYNGTAQGDGSHYNKIGIATSTDAGLTWTRHASNPVFSGYSGGDEGNVQLPSVVKIGSTYYMYYSYGRYNLSNDLLQGIRVASASSPFGPWSGTSSLNPTIATGYLEYHQVVRLDDGTLALLYEYWIGSPGAYQAYTVLGMATGSSASPTAAFTTYASNPIFSPTRIAGNWDGSSVATPSAFDIGGQWYLFYQGGADMNYATSSTWQLGVVPLSYTEVTTPSATPHRLVKGGSMSLVKGGTMKLK